MTRTGKTLAKAMTDDDDEVLALWRKGLKDTGRSDEEIEVVIDNIRKHRAEKEETPPTLPEGS